MTRTCVSVTTALLTLVWCLFLLPEKAHAYLDPGTGSYVLQLALAALVGALFLLKVFWTRIKSFFKKLFLRQTEADPDEQ